MYRNISHIKAHLHYDKNAAFSHQASWFYEPEKLFIRDKMANTNANTLGFCRNVNEPLKIGNGDEQLNRFWFIYDQLERTIKR